MSIEVEIIFIGLCSFLNMSGQHADMPPPSVILYQSSLHTPYIAFNLDEVTMTGDKVTLLGDYAMTELTGEALSLNDDHSKPPVSGKDFDKIAHFAAYSGIANPHWKRSVIPLPGHLPQASQVAGYLEFGGGTVTGGRITPGQWEFRDAATGAPSPTQKPDTFARSVSYKFVSATGDLIIVATALGGTSRRRLVFTPKKGPLRIWIGDSPVGMVVQDIRGDEPPTPSPAYHFAGFYASIEDPDPTIYIPFPVTSGPVVTGLPVPATPTTGYCGPDGHP